MKPHILHLFLAFLHLTTLQAQDSTQFLYIPFTPNIQFDGFVNEPSWDSIPPVEMVQYSPNAGESPTEKTEIRFAYDDNYFYGSMRGFDSDPNGVRGNSLYRDRLGGSDHFEILLDAFNDNETGFIFTTIPTGTRNDAAVTNDATGGTLSSGGWLNRDFNTFWDAEVSQDSTGWFAEIRVPFKSLRFQEKDGQVIMGLSAQRKISRKVERLIYPNIPPKTDFAFLRPSLAQKIILTGIKPTQTVYVSPYVLGGLERSNLLNESETEYNRLNNYEWNIGGDVKFSITNSLTMDFTVNTDFAQAEADDQLVNLTRFSVLFPEKRQFFQERAGVFDFRIGGNSKLFFSRRIGLTGFGEVVPIYGGVRLVGRMKTMDIGVLNMQTQSLGEIPSENFGVLRLRRRVFNQYSYLGGMFTSRMGTDGSRNMAYGIDGVVRLFGDDYITLQWAQTFDNLERELNQVENLNNARIAVEWNRRRREGLGYNAGFIYSGFNYNPGVGFVDRENFKFGKGDISYTWLYDNEAPFIWQQIMFAGDSYVDNFNNQLLSAEIGPEWSLSTRSLSSAEVTVKYVYEKLLEEFRLSEDATIPVGEYSFYRVSGSYRLAGERLLSAGLSLETGSFYDGYLHSVLFSPSWNVSKHLELDLEYSLNYAEFKDRNEHFLAHIVRLRIGTAVNRKISTNALVQYNSLADYFAANIRFRYNFREGNDLWIVFNEGLNTRRNDFYPKLPFSDAESILIKYIHTFQF